MLKWAVVLIYEIQPSSHTDCIVKGHIVGGFWGCELEQEAPKRYTGDSRDSPGISSRASLNGHVLCCACVLAFGVG